MKIIFQKIRYQNFLSAGNQWTEIELDKNQLTVIIGKNGSGKSTILDSLSFALFNKPFRKINKNQIINSITKKNCLVEIEFSIGQDQYKIVRGIKPNKFEIWKNESLINQTNNDEYQDYLEKQILRVSHKAFCQVVILGKASYIPFMELPTPQRREIIENLLDLEVFSSMNVILKKMNVENEKTIQDLKSQKTLLEDRIKLQSDYNFKRKEENEKKLSKWNMELNDLREYYSNSKAQFKEKKEISQYDIGIIEEAIRQCNLKSKDITGIIYKINHQIDVLKVDIKFYESHSECPECKQNIDNKFKEEILSTKKESLVVLKDSLKEVLEKEKKNEEVLLSKKEVHEASKKENEAYNFLKKDIIKVIEEAKSLKNDIDQLNQETYEDTGELDSLKLKLKESLEIFDNLNLEKDKMSILLKLLKDDGIKSKIVSQYTEIINTLINNYLLEMDFVCHFNLDENFNETIKSRYRDEFSFSSFSEGEKMRINLAILFTWYEIAKRRNSINSNILFFDEILDGSLEADGIEALLNIIRRLTDGNNCFIISHNDKSIDLIDNVIKFEKKKGFSHIIS